MANKNGHWYTDKNGNHYFVEEGQTPQEGWEASKRRKMINGGKYQVSEDGNEYKDVEKDEYDKFEADDASFDDNIDDDFGFDEDDEYDDTGSPKEFNLKDALDYDKLPDSFQRDYRNHGFKEAIERHYNLKIEEIENNDGNPKFRITEGEPDEVFRFYKEIMNTESNDKEYNREMQRAQEQNAAMSEGDDGGGDKYLAPEEIGIDYDHPEESIKYYEKKNNVKLYEQPNGSFKVVPNQSNPQERKYIRYPDGTIRWKDEIYPDEGSLEDIAGPEALKEIVDANDEENDERNFENEIEKRFSGWRPHWTNRKKNGGAHFEHDAFLSSFDYDNKVYKNTDDRIKWNRDMADYYRKNGQENAAKEYEDNASFIEKNKDRFTKYEKQANETRGKRWLQLQGENARISELKRGLRDGKYSVEDLMKYLKGE